MSSIVSWIAAEAEPPQPPDCLRLPFSDPAGDPSVGQDASTANDLQRPEVAEDPLDRNPELRTYRGRTTGMLRRYLRYSLETGRLPSLLGREFFRTRVTSYSVGTFEDRVILVRDMEICLQRLSEFSRQLLARYILQEHDLPATARLLHCNERTIRRTIPIALDELSEILLEVGLLESRDSAREKSCQGGKTGEFPASDCKEGKNKF
jgi:hypothetical protein